MKETIIKNCIKDNISSTIIYFLNTFFIILFFYLYTNGSGPIIYPIVLSVFVYMIFIVFKFYRYIKFNLSVKMSVYNPNYDIYVGTYEQNEIRNSIHEIHYNYLNKINSIYEEEGSKNKFFSQGVHNMKTPVSVIDLILQKLKNRDNIDTKFINEIEEENNKLLNRLDQVLNMIRLEDFSKDYVPQSVDLYDSLKKVINDRKNQFIYNNVFPKFKCNDESVFVLTDTKWNEFMIGQIVSNGIKYSYTQYDDKNIEASKNIYFNIEKQGKYVILTIKDEGIGIPEYDTNRVFQPFFTGENGRTHKESTGIGLYICDIVAEKLGHKITMKSKVGEGTEIQIKYLSKLKG